MSAITTHVLDTSRGQPANGISVTLEVEDHDDWKLVGKGTTNSDGRIMDLMTPGTTLTVGNYRLIFATDRYFADRDIETFYPQVSVVFRIGDPEQHFHVPLLLSPFGYSTYRGS